MDLTLTPEQFAAASLTREIFTDHCTQARLREVETQDDRFDRRLWVRLGEAGLIGLALPEELGGGGQSVLELASVIIEAGRTVAPLPLPWHAATALTIAEHGTDEQRRRWLPSACTGSTVLTAALSEDRTDVPSRPTVIAHPDADRWRLTGTKTVVPSGTVADLFVVPAYTAEGVTVFMMRPDDPGVRVVRQRINDGDSVARLDLENAAVGGDRILGGAGRGVEVTRWLAERLALGLCAQQLGVTEAALDLTSRYAGTREQFGRPIGTFQAVSQRLADGYIDLQGLRLTLWQAAWRLGENLPAEVEVATAKLWAADAGHRIAHTTVHVHGGVGVDLDGAAHRYFTAAKRIELTLGGATHQARIVGQALAAEPA
jgi:alkylation response protein AidB-like acyl-CoA dehydrogenase